MNKKVFTKSAFFNPRVVIALVISIATCSIVTVPLLAFLRPQAPANASQRTLSFEERVSYQRAIEDVYWRHRIWPKERPDPKPSLDAAMSRAQLEKKVKDYLRNSQALEDYWQRPITAEQLQAEMDRMATHTKQPEVLQELFEALGNDPFVIAECLARPALANRLLTNWYAYDQRIHGELKGRAETELKASPGAERMRQLSGDYSEMELVRKDSTRAKDNQRAGHSIRLNDHEWDHTVQKLAGTFSKATSHVTTGRDGSPSRPSLSARPAVAPYQTIPVGKLSSLQEDESRYYVTAVIKKTNDRLKLVTVSWPKEPLQSWLTRAETQFSAATAAPNCNYALPAILGGGCTDNTWAATAAPPEARQLHTAVWTGSEMIIWGGQSNGGLLDSGGRYTPATDIWIFTNSSGAPTGRSGHTAVWTGTEMIVWGGADQNGPFPVDTGGKYNPGADSWTPTSTTNAPEGRSGHTALWSGTQMIVWGGSNLFNDLNTGGRYDPDSDSWTATSTTNAPDPRQTHTAVWTGNVMIVWGGFDDFKFVDLNTGGRYNPNTDSWMPTTTTNAPDARSRHTAVSTDSEMIIWGGFNNESFQDLNTGGRYNPDTDTWTATNPKAPDPRERHTALWSQYLIHIT
jgi:N-acetylneuraminic acid mutarotase